MATGLRKSSILWILANTDFFLSEVLLKLAEGNIIWYTASEITACHLAHSLSHYV